jgi:hypothetical protein
MAADSILADVMKAASGAAQEATDGAAPEVADPGLADGADAGADEGAGEAGASGDAGDGSDTAGADAGSGRPARTRNPDGTFAKTEAERAAAAKKATQVSVKPTVKPAATPPAPAAQAKAGAPAPAQGQPAAAAVPPELAKAPASWKPVAREKWAALPAEVKAEALRLDREVRQTLQETAGARKFAEDFKALAQPYAPILGPDPMRTTAQLYHTVHQLQVGSPQQKAALLAGMIKGYGLANDSGIDLLVQHLQGGAPAGGGAAAPALDQEQLLAQAEQRVFKRIEAQRAKAHQARASSEIQQLEQEAEFLNEVREDVADLVESRARRGVALSPKAAYDLVLKRELADPESEIGGILRQRQAATAANAPQASTQRARAAGTSVKHDPSSPIGDKPDRSITEEIRAQATKLRRT